jgi:hypothetical protein
VTDGGKQAVVVRAVAYSHSRYRISVKIAAMVLPLAQPAMASRVGSFTVMYADCAVVIKLNTKSEGGTRSSTATISSRGRRSCARDSSK